MLSYIPTLDNQGEVKPEFNIADFKRGSGYVTLNDLLNYASLYSSNMFFGEQYFVKDILFSTYINNISSTVFNYLLGCKENIQGQFYKLNIKQKIRTIINNKIVSSRVNSDKITGNSIFCNEIHAYNVSYICFFNQNVSYPVLNSGSFASINSFKNDMPIFVNVYPGYGILVQNINRVPLFLYENFGEEIKHYISIGSYSISNLPYYYIIRRL